MDVYIWFRILESVTQREKLKIAYYMLLSSRFCVQWENSMRVRSGSQSLNHWYEFILLNLKKHFHWCHKLKKKACFGSWTSTTLNPFLRMSQPGRLSPHFGKETCHRLEDSSSLWVCLPSWVWPQQQEWSPTRRGSSHIAKAPPTFTTCSLWPGLVIVAFSHLITATTAWVCGRVT